MKIEQFEVRAMILEWKRYSNSIKQHIMFCNTHFQPEFDSLFLDQLHVV